MKLQSQAMLMVGFFIFVKIVRLDDFKFSIDSAFFSGFEGILVNIVLLFSTTIVVVLIKDLKN